LVHAYKETAAIAITSGPAFDKRIDLLPAAKVEVANAEVRTVGNFESFAQRREKLLVDVVENSWHFL
jgi:hypothetical protein